MTSEDRHVERRGMRSWARKERDMAIRRSGALLANQLIITTCLYGPGMPPIAWDSSVNNLDKDSWEKARKYIVCSKVLSAVGGK